VTHFFPVGLFDDFKRWRLAQRGMSSGKKRRVQSDSTVALSLDRSRGLRFVLHLLFCLAAALLVLRGARSDEGAAAAADLGVYGFFVALAAVVAVELNLKSVARRNGRLILMFGGILAHLALARAVMVFAELNQLPAGVAFLLTPFVLAPMVHAVLLGRAAGVMSAVVVSLLAALMVPAAEAPRMVAVSLLCGLVVVAVLHTTRRRVQLLRGGLYAGLTSLLLAIALGVIDFSSLGSGASMTDWKLVGFALLAAVGTGVAIALLVSGCLPVLEGMFSLTTDISWLELSDLNHKLLKRMQLEAPGTFHHSLVVAALAESAAEAVGANAAMCRVCSYFHDIGKLSKPEYFIENQVDGAENPHDTLTPTMSALIIIAHVKDGVDLAIKHKLNPRVIEVIQEHHGDSLVSYFYRRAQEQKRAELEKVEKKLENPEDLPKVDQKNFRYPGPRPRSRESGIISLADAIESASRTLKKPTPARIGALVEELIEQRVCDGQLDDCALTMRDLGRIKEVFAKTLRSMLHSRIDYPKDEDRGRKSDLGSKTQPAKTQPAKTQPLTGGRPAPVPRREEPDPVPPVEAMKAACWGR